MKKIKVLNLIWHMGDGGAQQIVLNYLRFFQNDPDIDFRLCVFTGPTNSKYDREIREKNYDVVYLNEPDTRCPIPYIRRFFRQAVVTKAWESAIRDFQPDIVHIHLSALLGQSLPAIVNTGVPVRLYTLHSNPYRQQGRLRKSISNAFQLQNVIPICLTEEQADMAKDWYGIEKYELVRNGIDIEGLRRACCSRQEARSFFGLDPDAFVVIGVGRLNPVKNYPLLIESFVELRRSRPDALLVFAGDGPEKTNLTELIRQKSLTEHVRFLGSIPDVTKLYCAADVIAVPSFSEALPLVVLEGQICGLRCVVSDGVPAESILLEHSKKMPAGASPKEWAKALQDTGFSSSPFPLELYDLHQVNRQIKEIYLKYYLRAADQQPATK